MNRMPTIKRDRDEMVKITIECCCKEDNDEALTEILQERVSDSVLHAQQELGEALITASRYGSIKCVKTLLEHGVDVNSEDAFHNTGLLLASETGAEDVVKILLEAGADPNRSDQETRLPIHWSAVNGHTDIVQILLKHGSHADMPDKTFHFTPLMLAARHGFLDILKTLINDYRCQVDRDDIHHETALFETVRNGHALSTRFLIESGADIEWRSKTKQTPLIVAVLWKRPKQVLELVKANCDINVYSSATVQNYNFVGPALEIALLEGIWSAVKILLVVGAKIHPIYTYVRSQGFLREFHDIPSTEKAVPDWLTEMVRNPHSLKELCRVVIRESTGQRLISEREVNLPTQLCDYLLVPELEMIDFEDRFKLFKEE